MRARVFFVTVLIIGLAAALGAHAQEATQTPPDALKVYQRGRDLESAGRTPEANAQYLEAIAICDAELQANPARMESFVVKSWSQLRLKRYADVIATGLAALKISTDYRIVEVLGEAYFYQTDMQTSLRYFQRYVDGVPEGADKVAIAYYFMGEAYSGLQQYDHADIAFTTALYMSPKSFRWWHRYGVLREKRGERDLALKAYEKSLELSPAYAEAIAARDRLKAQQ